MSRTGGVINVQDYYDDFAKALSDQYIRTQKAFTGETTAYLKENLDDEDDESMAAFALIISTLGTSSSKFVSAMEANTQLGLDEFRRQEVPGTTGHIVRTTQKDIDTSVRTAEQTLRSRINGLDSNGQELPKAQLIAPEGVNKALAREATTNFKRKSKSRPANIAVAETQKSAESTKEIERDSYRSVTNGVTASNLEVTPNAIEEHWITMGDSDVRPAHLEADYQLRKNDMYLVDNQRLRFPGDRSLGATNKNVMGCRCSSVSSIK